MDGKLARKTGVPVTSFQVARLAGVSQSAVSRSFTPGASVAPKTRAKVLEAARSLGYRPNAIARSLITSRSRIIGVVMAYLENLFYPSVLEELGRLLSAQGYHMLLFTGFKDRDSDPVFDQIMRYRVDGIILASTGLSSELSEECAAAGIPVVLFNRTTTRDAVSSVTTNNYEGGRKVADFLVAGGHKRFGYIAGLANSSTNRDRQAGFIDGLAAHGVSKLEIRTGDYSGSQAAIAARALLALPKRLDAMFVANDHMAIAVIDVARSEFGLTLPDDISVVGYDNVGPASWPGYAITTVSQPMEVMVAGTVELMMRQIESRQIEAVHRVIACELIVRGSARRPTSGVVKRGEDWIYAPDDAKGR